jgi:tetratricopeptide (TPR) repeat protein
VHAAYAINAAGAGAELDDVRASLEEAARVTRDHIGPRHPALVLAEPILSLFGGDIEVGERLIRRQLDDQDPWVVAVAHTFLAHLRLNFGQIEAGEPHIAAALEGFRRLGDRWGMGLTMGALSELQALRGDFDAAIGVMNDALALTAEMRIEEDMPYMRSRLALALDRSGDRAGAEAQLAEAERVCLALHDNGGVGHVHHIRAEFARWDGDLEKARSEYAEATAYLERATMVSPQQLALTKGGLGMLAEQEGDAARARRLHSAALKYAVECQDGPILAGSAVAWAGLAVLEGNPARAAFLLGGAHAIRGTEDAGNPDSVRIADMAKAALGPRYEAEYERGRMLTREEAIAALDQAPDGRS